MEKEAEQSQPEASTGISHKAKIWIAVAIFAILVVIGFFVVRPYIIAMLWGVVFAYILRVPYMKLNKATKKPTASALIICIIVLVILGIATFFLAQIVIKQAFYLYMNIQKIDLFKIVNYLFVNIFHSNADLARQITLSIQQGLSELTSSFVGSVGSIITKAPQFFLELFVVIISTFYFLKDGSNIVARIREILPFKKNINEKFVKRTKDVAYGTIYGQVIIGIIQGVVTIIGFYIFHAPSPLFFGIIATLFAIIPIGPWVVWIPVGLMMLASGSYLNGALLLAFGILVVSTIDNIIRPFVVGKASKINYFVVLIGMLGGIALLGPVGLFIGPLVIEFILIFVEIYRNRGKVF